MGINMKTNHQPQDRQQILIDLYCQYLKQHITMGELLMYLRKKVLGMSQEQYANFVGISRRTLSDIELNKGKLSQSILDKVFKPLGLQTGLVPIPLNIVEKILKTPNYVPDVNLYNKIQTTLTIFSEETQFKIRIYFFCDLV